MTINTSVAGGAEHDVRQRFKWLLPLALSLPLLVLTAFAWLAWRDVWRSASFELTRGAEAAAEYALRVLDNDRLAADLANRVLRGLSDQEIRAREGELHRELQQLLPSLPGVLTVAVLNRNAELLLTANTFPVPRGVRVPDREWMVALRAPDAPDLHVSAVTTGRVDDNVFFAVSRRRTESGNGRSPGAFDGVIQASVDPVRLSADLAAIGGEHDVAALLRVDGALLARSTGFPFPPPQIPPRSPFRDAASAGQVSGTYMGQTLGLSPAEGVAEAHLIAFRRVRDLPLYVTTARPTTAIVARWRRTVALQLALGLPAWMALVGCALLLRRTQIKLVVANTSLEQRIAERTAAVREGEARLRIAQQAAQIGTWVLEPLTGEVVWSDEQYALFGMDCRRDGPVNYTRFLDDVVYPQDRLLVDAATVSCFASGEFEADFRAWRLRLDGTREVRWITGRGRRVAAPDGGPGQIFGVNVDITERKVVEAQLAASEAEFRAIFENSIVGKSQTDPETLRYVRVNKSLCEITGYSEQELLSMTFLDVTHPEDRAGNEAGFRAAVAAGEPYRVEKRVRRKDGAIRWVLISASLLPATAVRQARAISVMQDITERRRAEERQALLAGELDHRAKNALAVVQAALRLTPKCDAHAYARAIEGRVAALARAHTILAVGKWERAALRELIEAELATFQPDASGEADAVTSYQRVMLNGPDLPLASQAVQAISMALHELATNAAKYGALSVPEGRVVVCWKLDGQFGQLVLTWRECGGPRLTGTPSRRGFGSRVIEATVQNQLGGRVECDWDDAGLVCTIAVPIARVLADLCRESAV
ncbi:PAS domain S-box protein [Falsiroseomonas sp. HW251]|uniref:PAS domain S-box protein n=1 Tax=Falsiroseomonas sp. HW251 TaxID=3390998 RepID=UPI003D31979A